MAAWDCHRRACSEHIRDDFLGMGLDAGVADVFGAGSADFVSGDAVGLWVENVVEGAPELVEGIGLETAFEDGVLDAHAEVLAGFCDFGEAFGFADIVGDKGEHLFGAAFMAGGFGGVWDEGKGGFPPSFRWSGCGRADWFDRPHPGMLWNPEACGV